MYACIECSNEKDFNERMNEVPTKYLSLSQYNHVSMYMCVSAGAHSMQPQNFLNSHSIMLKYKINKSK